MRVEGLRWWLILVLVSVGMVLLDIATGPYVQFPIVFVVPVGLAAHHLGRWPAVGFAASLVAARLVVARVLEPEHNPAWAAGVNAVVRLLVLLAIVAVVEAQRRNRALQARVQALEGILPICSFCKKIRKPDGDWQAIESYVSERSAANFSHSLCEPCLRANYPDYSEEPAPRP